MWIVVGFLLVRKYYETTRRQKGLLRWSHVNYAGKRINMAQ